MTLPTILITGCLGQVGWELQRTLATLGRCVAIDRDELDLTQPDLVREYVRDLKPSLIVNAAAYTAVDLAEQESDLAQKLNADAPRVLAEEAKKLRAPFITYSTDYVFDGTSTTAYKENSVPNPLGEYGRSKLSGDQAVASVGGAHLIFRTSWVYGARGKNFLLTMLRIAQDRTEIRIVDDQVGAPTWCRTVAEATAQVVAAAALNCEGLYGYLSERSGVYNMVSAGQTSWFGFAKAIFEQAGKNKSLTLVPIATNEYPTPAARPKNSLLSTDKIRAVFGIQMPDWEQSLSQVIESLNLCFPASQAT
jgi:dTDP-4-dehydrorhamnose reductase